MPISSRGQRQDDRRRRRAEDPGQPGDRGRDEERLLPAGTAAGNGPAAPGGQRHQQLEGPPLDPVDLEHRQQQPEVGQHRQELPHVAAAGLGLAGVEPSQPTAWQGLGTGAAPALRTGSGAGTKRRCGAADGRGGVTDDCLLSTGHMGQPLPDPFHRLGVGHHGPPRPGPGGPVGDIASRHAAADSGAVTAPGHAAAASLPTGRVRVGQPIPGPAHTRRGRTHPCTIMHCRGSNPAG